MTRVLLTYGWVRSSYAVLRNLQAHGIEVYVADRYRTGMCQWSRKKSGFDRYPSHYADAESFVSAIAEICHRRSIDLIFASHNETEILARYRHWLPPDAAALLPDASHCAMFNNKAHAYSHAAAVGVPVPARVEYDRPDQVSQAIGDVGLGQTVIKLLTGNSSKGVFYAQTPDAAQRIVTDLVTRFDLDDGRLPQIEERVFGEGWGSSVMYWKGRRIAGFTHRRLREKIDSGGTSTLRECQPDAALEHAASQMFDAIGWHGLAMAEFKRCPDTGRFWFIEVNPRLWGSLPLAIASGVEFPYLAYLCATEGPEAAISLHANTPVTTGWCNRWLLGDLAVTAKALLRRRPGHAINTVFRARVDAVDDVFFDDPLVFPGELTRYIVGALRTRSMNPVEDGMIG